STEEARCFAGFDVRFGYTQLPLLWGLESEDPIPRRQGLEEAASGRLDLALLRERGTRQRGRADDPHKAALLSERVLEQDRLRVELPLDVGEAQRPRLRQRRVVRTG